MKVLKNKKVLVVIAGILAIALTVILISVFAMNCKKKQDGDSDVHYTIDYLVEEYVAGDSMVFRVRAVTDKEPSSIVFTFDNGAEKTLTAKVGETEDEEKSYGDYYIDTGTETFDLSDVAVGEHLIKFYVYEGDTRIALGKAILINILSAE